MEPGSQSQGDNYEDNDYFGDYRKEGAGLLPHRVEVRYGDKVYAVLEVQDYKLQPAGK